MNYSLNANIWRIIIKNIISLLFSLVFSVTLTSVSVFGEEAPKVIVNNNEIFKKAIIKDNRTLVPFRGVFEELGFEII